MEYVLILILFVIATIFLKWKFKIQIYKSKNHLIMFNATFFIISTLWDYFATWRGHWTFEGPGLVGIKILWLPVEEFLFFLIVPQFGLALYKLFEKKVK